MLKIVVFDSGYGGELFADKLSEKIGVVEIIRVIDWRNSKEYLDGKRKARQLAEKALRPYIGKVDLIIFANTLLSITSIKYFRQKYKIQKFAGLGLKLPDTTISRKYLILTTSAVAKTIAFHDFLFRIKQTTKTLTLDSWLDKIDDGELGLKEIENTINQFRINKNYYPKGVILACTHFNDIKPALIHVLGGHTKIYDSFDDGIDDASRILRLRGGIKKRR